MIPRTVEMLSRSAMLALITCLFYFAGNASSAITIDTVPIGNVGNANDAATGGLYGGVNYAFSIGKHETTVGQYTAFLNAVATTDTYNLYRAGMQFVLNSGGIAQTGSPGSYTYSVIGSPDHPVTYVDWGRAARFINWLHNGQPTGPQNSATTEDGAYTLNGATSDAALFAVSRNPNAKWFLPSESEWYKAAYHQPAVQGGDSDNYWNYPMKTNNQPFSDQPAGATPDNTRVGNFNFDDNLANGYNDGYAVSGNSSYQGTQNYLTDVGAYTSSPSFYGTFDQGGNVYEWTEGQLAGSFRILRGGSWYSVTVISDNLAASARLNGGSTYESSDAGFRVATVTVIPEPATAMLVIVAGGLMSMMPRRRK